MVFFVQSYEFADAITRGSGSVWGFVVVMFSNINMMDIARKTGVLLTASEVDLD